MFSNWKKILLLIFSSFSILYLKCNVPIQSCRPFKLKKWRFLYSLLKAPFYLNIIFLKIRWLGLEQSSSLPPGWAKIPSLFQRSGGRWALSFILFTLFRVKDLSLLLQQVSIECCVCLNSQLNLGESEQGRREGRRKAPNLCPAWLSSCTVPHSHSRRLYRTPRRVKSVQYTRGGTALNINRAATADRTDKLWNKLNTIV